MESYYGFDLGDAESAVARLDGGEFVTPEIVPVQNEKSFVTAYASLPGGEVLIGENACYSVKAVKKGLRFKSRFLKDPASHNDIRLFAGGVLEELYRSGETPNDGDACMYIGCPAGWNKNDREKYRSIFENAGYPPVRIVSESRAAMVSACQSKHLQVGYDILSKSVLVVDIGSSTTDFAYIRDGHEIEMRTSGEVALGGGIMDEILLEECLSASRKEKEIRKAFDESVQWKTYCEFSARRLKEKYFSDEEYWSSHECSQSVRIMYARPVVFRMVMNRDMASRLINRKVPALDGRSFKDTFIESLREIRAGLDGELPELLFLTGGVSKMSYLRDWCTSVFPESIVITGSEPEFSVARGLAWSGRIDSELKAFRQELDELIDSTAVEDVVEKHIPELYHASIEALASPLLKATAVPIFERWRNGEIRRLVDTDTEMDNAIRTYLHSEEAREILARPVARWIRAVADDLEEYTVPICIRHNVPYKALSLNSFFKTTDIDIRIEAKDIFALEEVTWLIDSLISIIVGLLCGGSGIALISSGPGGIIAGAALSLMVLVLGKNHMEKALLKADIPGPARKLVTKHSFENRIEKCEGVIKRNFYDTLDNEKGEELSERLITEISAQIEECLTRMAEIVEIPLGQKQ